MKIIIGALAHVDAGKTTLAESILYKTNSLRKKGNIDNANCFLDFNEIEKQKGITIFNKQAQFKYKDKEYIYIDTPGHNDLAYESSRAINILDCAIVLISAIEDIPLDTINKFNYLLNYNIPIIIFVNKMDISNFTQQEILNNLKNKLSDCCIDYTQTVETVSLSNEEILETYINTNTIDTNIITSCLNNNDIIPCFFGSALKDEGIDELLDYIYNYINANYNENIDLNAYVYKLNNDYSFLKILSGTLKPRTSFGDYKITEIYDCNGDNYTPINTAKASNIVAVKGLNGIQIGTYIPSFNMDELYKLPSLTYRIISNLDSNELYRKIESINNEFPELSLTLENNSIFINLNGELHSTIIRDLLKTRFDIDVKFSDPIIKYKETINEEVYGVGHFEPLRHYAEAIVKLKPCKDGIKVNSLIDNNYSNTLVSYLRNYKIRGILTNSPLTNIEITLVDIKTHPKHTEGQDLIQSVRRAIRQALSKTNSILLEPFYMVCIDTNQTNMNEIISFLTNNKCTYTLLQDKILSKIALKKFNSIMIGLKSKLRGQLSFNVEETLYDDCADFEQIIKNINYDYLNDMANPAGSIFCKSGAGHYVQPQDVETNMHLNLSDYFNSTNNEHITHNRIKVSDEELARVINSLYKPKPRYTDNKNNDNYNINKHNKIDNRELLYLIDGYNLMYYIDEENALNDLLSAREKLINIVCDFAGYVSAEVILVFDAYKQDCNNNEVIKRDNITIIYTKHKQTADNYIELKSKELADIYKVIVVTSDALEQLRVFANSASRISSREFMARYNNLRKNATKLNKDIKYKPLIDLRKLLED